MIETGNVISDINIRLMAIGTFCYVSTEFLMTVHNCLI